MVCWNCGGDHIIVEPDPDMNDLTDRIRCTDCNELQEEL